MEGLSDQEVLTQRRIFGQNIRTKDTPAALRILVGVLTEPMLILLMVACATYFLLGSVVGGLS